MAITVTDIMATLRQSIYGPNFDVIAGQGAIGARVPFLFTSRKRLGILVPTTITDASQQIDSAIPQPDISSAPRVIKMAVNPDTINWKQAKRIVRKDTQEGAVFFHFNNGRGQDNDIVTLEMRGTTGNINRVVNPNIKDGGNNPYLKSNEAKLQCWHNLYNLTREEKLFQSADNLWHENEFYIVYTTKLFPMGIRLAGFFNQVLHFEEHASDPNKRTYSLSFTVTDTSPDLDTVASSLYDYMNAQAIANAQFANQHGSGD